MSETFSVKAILSADDGSFRSVFNNAQGVLSSFASSTCGLTGKLSSVTSMVKGGLGFGVLSGIGQSAFGAVTKAVSGLTSNLGGAISRYDTLKQFPKTMELMGFKTEETEKASKKLVDAIDGLPTTLDGITKNAQNIALITGNLDKATDTTIALNNAFLMSGSSTADAERGLQQYVQMMSAGKVDMQSWRTLLDTMSPALTKVAESFGYTGESAKTDLYEALQSGKITFDDFNTRMIEMNNGMDIAGEHFEGFAALAKTSSQGIGTSIENLKTTVTKQMANTIKAFDDAGLSIAGSIDTVKSKINELMTNFIGNDKVKASGAFTALVDAGLKAKDALVDSFHKFANSPAMAAAKTSIENIANNLGVILPNMIHALEPILEGVISTVSRVFSAISTVIARVTSNPAFQIFAENIGKAIDRIGRVAESVINHMTPFITAILGAANEVIGAFGKAFDAIVRTAQQTDLAGRLYGNFQKVLGFVKDALIRVAGFLEKHHGWILKIIEHLPQIITLIASVKIALLAMEKIKGFMALTDQVKNFLASLKNAGTKVSDFATGIVSKFTGSSESAGNQLVSLSGRADTAFMNISRAAESSGSGITSKIGGAFSTLTSKVSGALGNVASSVGNVVSTIGSIAGPIAMVAGPAIAAITGIVNAIIAWREKQKEVGRDMAQFTEEQQALIDKNKELVDSYSNMHETAQGRLSDAEAEAAYARSLRDEYSKLIDENGNVIAGNEKLAETIRGKLYEAVGVEIGQVDELRNEYLKLVDENGNIISGYEERAVEIQKSLSDILGHEITKTDQIKNLAHEEMATIDELIEKKQMEAKASVLTDAYKESFSQKSELYKQEKQLLQEKADLEKEIADMEQGIFTKEFENNTQRNAYQEERKNKLEEVNESIKKNRDTQLQCDADMQLSTEAMTAAAKGDYAELSVLEQRYIGDLITAQDAVRQHGTTAREVLEQQVEDARTNYEQIKASYDAHEAGVTQTQVDEAKKRLEFSQQQQAEILNNQELGYAERLKNQIENDDLELKQLKAHLDELQGMRQDQQGRELIETQRKYDALVEQRNNDQKNYDDYMNGLNTSTQIGYNNINQSTATGMNQVNQTANAKMQEGTANAGKEGQNTNAAYTGGLFGMIKGTTDIAVSSAKNMVGALQSGAKDAGTAASSAKTAVTNGFNGMDSAIGASGAKSMLALQGSLIVSSVMSMFLGSTVGKITRPFQNIDLGTAGSNAMIGMYNGMNAKAMMLYNLANTIASNIAATMMAALQIHSPSRLTKWMGNMLGEGLVVGIDQYQTKTERAAQMMAESASEQFENVNKLVNFSNVSRTPNIATSFATHSTFTKDENYNYSGTFQATIEVPVNLNGREVSRLTVNTDGEEQYFHQKRYGR